MNYDYLICGLRVRFMLPWTLKVTHESRDFLIASEFSRKADLTVHFSAADSLSIPEGGGIWNINSYFASSKNEQKIWHCPIRGKPPYCSVTWNTDSPDEVMCTYVTGMEHQIAYTKNLIELLGLETFLLRFGGMILHSSLVDWEGRGILFSAPCGTGKSTQASLWEEHLGSRTLNGDRAGIRFDCGVWRAWGLPFAGTSGIYRNESVPIRTVVLLRQGPENVITRVTPMEAFRRMLPECSARRWDPDFMGRLIEVLSALINDLPIYQLECRADFGAVKLLRDTILEEE